MKKAIMSAFTVLFSYACSAQESDSLAIKRYYEQNTILWTGQNRYYKDNKVYPLRHLQEEFQISKEAMQEYLLFRKNRRSFFVMYTIGLGTLVTSIAAKQNSVKVPLLATSFACIGFSVNFSIRSVHHLGRSFWVYNRDVLLK